MVFGSISAGVADLQHTVTVAVSGAAERDGVDRNAERDSEAA